MAKILVADDNSNVQKTVTLALANLGVEVVAVNNGEAAVRKLAEVSPDLVLADIFMPVRNGYEVCEYVKKDKNFSHVPVVLLVGAFDPLDEREAQRVGADGILKKPFVPPDPLIMMVKTLLDRTLGDRLVAVEVSRPSVAAQARGTAVATVDERPSPSVAAKEYPAEEFAPPVDRVSFAEGEHPIAFGRLLDPPVAESGAAESRTTEPVDDEQILTSSRDASLGEPIFWKPEEPVPETSEQDTDAENDISAGLPEHAWKPDESVLAHEPEPAPAAELEALQPVEPFELVRDDRDQEVNESTSIVEPSVSLVKDPAEQASLTVEVSRPEDLAANPIEWMASVPPPPAEEPPTADEEYSVAVAQPSDKIAPEDAVSEENLEPAAEEFELEPITAETLVSDSLPASAADSASHPSVDAELVHEPEAGPSTEEAPSITAVKAPDPHKTQPSLAPFGQSAEDTARSIPVQTWPDLTESAQTAAVETASEKSEPVPAPEEKAEVAPAANLQKSQIPDAPVPAPLMARAPSAPEQRSPRSFFTQKWADLAESLRSKPSEAALPKSEPTVSSEARTSSEPEEKNPEAALVSNAKAPATLPAETGLADQPHAPNPESSNTPDPALVEAVVQRVLDKMRPQVVDIITKEFLRPVVQALVSREISKH